VSRRDDERLADILASAEAIAAHLERGGLGDGLVFDAVRVRLIEIGEASERHRPGAAGLRGRDPMARRGWDAGPPRPPVLRHDPLDRPGDGRGGPATARRRRQLDAVVIGVGGEVQYTWSVQPDQVRDFADGDAELLRRFHQMRGENAADDGKDQIVAVSCTDRAAKREDAARRTQRRSLLSANLHRGRVTQSGISCGPESGGILRVDWPLRNLIRREKSAVRRCDREREPPADQFET